jgi:hypothetical protein
VFYATLSQSVSAFFAFTGTLAAVILIDLLYLSLVGMLQAERSEDEVFETRWAYAIGLIALYASIIAIGMLDEGIMAIAPRIGLGIITMIATLQFWFQWRKYQDDRWQERFEIKKARNERKDQQKLLKKQRRVKNKQQFLALKEIQGELLEEYKAKHRVQLLTLTGNKQDNYIPDPPVIDMPKPARVTAASNGHTKQLQLSEPLYKGIDPTEDGKYHWICEFCEKEGVTDTESGARIAQSRHMNQCKQTEYQN